MNTNTDVTAYRGGSTNSVRAPIVFSQAWISLAALVVLAVFAAACTTDSATPEYGQDCASFHPDPEYPFFAANRDFVDPSPAQWSTADPGEVGMDGSVLQEASDAMAQSPVAASLLVARHGELVFERYFNGFDSADALNVHSIAKSITSVLTGIAIEEGRLEIHTRLDEVLPPDLVFDHGQLTVGDLLTMSGGLEVPKPDGNYEWEPSDLPGEPSMIRAVLSSPRVAEPGTEFSYNTGLTQVLGAMVTEASGMSLCDYATERLLGPLGIDVEGWHVEPGGYFSGGSGMFMTPREIARFGQLILDGGLVDRRQLVSTAWLDESLSSRWELGCLHNQRVAQSYGYLWWRFDIGGHTAWNASGFGGQDLVVVADLDLVVVATHDTSRAGARVSMTALLDDLLLGAVNGQVPPQPSARCTANALSMTTVAADGTGSPDLVPYWPYDTVGPFSPDRNLVVFSRSLDYWDLYTIDSGGTDIRMITGDAIPDAMPSWSPDGTLLAFARGEPSQSDLYLISPEGSGLEQLTNLEGYEQAPTWSPAGERIAFVWGHQDVNGWGHPGQLWVIDRDGSNLEQLRAADTSNPKWSPDGRQIVFDNVTGDGHIGLLDLESGAVTDLGKGLLPTWSPDGTRIVFVILDDASGSSVHTMAADGSDRIQLTSGLNVETAPSWSSDGRTIIFWTLTRAP